MMGRIINLLPVFFLLFILVPGSQAGNDDLRIGIDSVEVSGNEVQLTVTITDKLGMGISSLDSTDFEISLPVVDSLLTPSCIQSHEGSALVLCIDNSGLMPVEKVVEALVDYMGSIRPQDRVAVIAFNDGVETVSAFSGNVSHLRSRISELEREGSKTELFQGIYEGLRLLRDHTPEGLERRYLLVFSDGRNEYYDAETYNIDHCIDLANEIGVPIISVAFDSSYSALSSMDLMSDRTGGFYTEALAVQQIGDGFVDALSILDSQYYIEFNVPDTLLDSFEHEFTVSVKSGTETGESIISLEFQAPYAPPESKGLSLILIIIIVVILLIIAFIVYFLVKRAAQRKIDVLNDELLSKNDKLSQMEIEAERKTAEQRRAIAASSKTKGGAVGSKDKGDRSRFRKTMIGTAPAVKYNSGSLLVQSGSNKGTVFNLTKPVTTIGRQSDNDIVVDSETSNSTVSRQHAVIKFSGGEFMIQDRDSGNGTFVNGRRISNSPLTNGDIIKLGRVQIAFRGE